MATALSSGPVSSPKRGRAAAGIQYAGEPGVTQTCVEAIVRLIQCRTAIQEARLLTAGSRHAIVLTLPLDTTLAVKTGFRSGYIGEGPAGLSRVVALLDFHRVEIDEYTVEAQLLDRLDASALTNDDLTLLTSQRAIRPQRWHDYIVGGDLGRQRNGTIWQDFCPVLPLAIIDPRIADLAKTFWEAPGDRIMDGYRRLEDTVRQRTGIDEHGQKLFSEAFLGTPPKLVWKGCGHENEQKGRAQIFAGAFMGYRNARAHREVDATIDQLLTEFILLNHLFRLEREAEAPTPAVP